MQPSKKSAPKAGKIWNFGDIGTRWSSRRVTSSLLSTGVVPRQTTTPTSSNSHSNPATKSKADGDDEEHSDSELPQPRPITSFLEGGQESSNSQDLPTTSTPMANRRSRGSTTPSSRVPSTPKTSSSLSPVPSLAQTPVHNSYTSSRRYHTNIGSGSMRQKNLDANSIRFEEVLRNHIAEMKKTHAYIVRSTLTAARLDLNSRTPPPGIIYDETSPFEDMKSIEIAVTEAKDKRIDVGRFSVRVNGKAHSNEIKLVVPATVSETPKTLAQMPKYHSYTTLRNNILADDDEIMRYFPYFGEDVEEDELHLEDTFLDKTKSSAEEGKNSEYAALYTTFINSFLKDLNLSIPSVTHYLLTPHPRNESIRRQALPNDFDPQDPKVRACRENLKADISADELDRAETACRVFMQITDLSMWEIMKRADQMVKERVDPPRTGMGGGREEGGWGGREGRGVVDGEDPAPYSLDSYAALNCLLCFMHECPFHVNKDHDRLAMSTITATGKDKTIFRLATNVQGWSYGAKGATKDPWIEKQGEEKLCSEGCFMKEINKETAETGVWSTAQLELLRSSAGVLKMNPRCACLITCIINKPCAEIYRQLGIENLLMPPGCQTEDQVATVERSEPRPGAKRKKPAVPSLPGYPTDCYLTHAHERRSAFQACRHLGQCTESCPCVISHVTCEKSCICSPDCPRRWRGCACKREGRACTKDSCICVKANRECDVDLCHSCGSAEALDPVNRYEDRFLREGCQNVWLQRDMPKRTLLGRSAVAGFGLFVGEDVKKDAFLGEYKGEVITSDEADRRGKLYDKRGVSFLFNLNLNHVIDATRAGNKFRYVNHSKTSPNCGAKVFMVNCTHRIGMFARRDLSAGEELFFDYGYNNKQIKFVQKEFEPPEMINPSTATATGAAKKKRTRRKELEYLKGGKGTTERSRARITAAEANLAKPSQTTTLPISTAATRVRDRSTRSSEYTHETTSEEDSHHQEEVSGESVDEEYEPEPETEESLAVAEIGSTADVTEIEESEEEPPRRPKRFRGRGH